MSSYVYALVDPRTGLIGYIGKSDYPNRRLRQHIEDALEGTGTPKKRWIRELLVEHRKAPQMVILEQAEGRWRERERWWIAFGRKLGWPLTNATDGGDGPRDED